jgi:hypothetical protein
VIYLIIAQTPFWFKLENVEIVKFNIYKFFIFPSFYPKVKNDPPPIWSISKILNSNFFNFYGWRFIKNNYKLSYVRFGLAEKSKWSELSFYKELIL